MYNTIIIGGGAAGLFCVANLKGDNNLLLEGSKKLGQKILITGGGMCNITNMDSTEDFIKRFGDKKKLNFIKPALLNLPTDKTRDWLESIGLELGIRDDGKVFPKSLKAQSLVNALQKKAIENGVRIKYNSRVTGIKYKENQFILKCGSDIFECQNLVIATGGKSFPETGSDGLAYNLLKSLGHKIIEPTEALVGVKIANHPLKTLSGTSIKNSSVDFFRDGENKRYLTQNGDLLFTHHGLSGPVILNNSRDIISGDTLYASIISCDNKEESRTEILEKMNSSAKTSIKRFLKELGLTTATALVLGNFLKLSLDQPIKELNKKLKSKLLNHLLNFPLKVSSKGGFNSAMVTAGGVDISQIDRKTMESKIIPNLYFAGEVIDIDGDTGGYNIQVAFSTAKLISNHLNC